MSRIVFKDAPDRSGVIIREDGRLCIVSDGAGLSVQLDATRLRELGRRCVTVAALIAEREEAAASEAAVALSRVVAGNG